MKSPWSDVCTKLMYVFVCVFPDPQKEHIKHRKAEDSEDNDTKRDKKSSTCIVL